MTPLRLLSFKYTFSIIQLFVLANLIQGLYTKSLEDARLVDYSDSSENEILDENKYVSVESLPEDIFNDDSNAYRLSKQQNPGYKPVRSGVGSGYLRMKVGQVVTVRSSNFGTGPYYNNEAYVWRFFGHQCILSAQCPCADIPLSQGCLGDYLKISDTFLFNQRFCGELKPDGSYQSATNNLKIKFRSDSRETGLGFLCYVSCAASGQTEYVVPTNVTCPGTTLTASPTPTMTTTPTKTTSTTPMTGPTTPDPPNPDQ